MINESEQSLLVELPPRSHTRVLDVCSRRHVRALPALQQIDAFAGTFVGSCCREAASRRKQINNGVKSRELLHFHAIRGCCATCNCFRNGIHFNFKHIIISQFEHTFPMCFFLGECFCSDKSCNLYMHFQEEGSHKKCRNYRVDF
jgi:hypothetical protein